MRSIFFWLFVFVGIASSSLAQTADKSCGDPPPVANENLKGEIVGGAKLVGSRLGSADLKLGFERSRQEIYSKYPRGDLASADRYYLYEVCQVVMKDPTLTTMAKVKVFTEARQSLRAVAAAHPTAQMRPKASPNHAPNSAALRTPSALANPCPTGTAIILGSTVIGPLPAGCYGAVLGSVSVPTPQPGPSRCRPAMFEGHHGTVDVGIVANNKVLGGELWCDDDGGSFKAKAVVDNEAAPPD